MVYHIHLLDLKSPMKRLQFAPSAMAPQPPTSTMGLSPATRAERSFGGALGSHTAVWRELETVPLTGPTGGHVSGVGLTGEEK